MASAAPSGSEALGELTCPICLDAFRCPCTLSCGHSFCLKCVEGAWDATKSFSCPQCRVTFLQRPKLSKNFTLANLVEQRSAAEKIATVVLCDFCNDGTTAALKTCLRCDTSYCVTHVKPHQENPKFKDHILVAPATNPEDRKCKTHRKELEFYCRQDKSLVCITCTIAGDHKGHDVATLEDEHKTREKQVGEETRAVEEKRREAEESVRWMEATRRDVQGSMTGVRKRINGEFAHMRAALDEDEKAALARAAKKERELLTQIEKNIAHYQREIGELQAAAARLEGLAQERDSLAFLQGSMTGVRQRINGEFARMRAALDEDEKAALARAAMKERELLTQIEKNIAHYQREIGELRAAAARLQALAQERDSLAFLQGHLEETCRRGQPRKAPPSAPNQEDIASLKGIEGTVAKLMYGCSPTLDTNSAHNQLQIFSDLRTMTAVFASQGRPDHPHRFDGCAQALCCESFSSGHHYWEVDVGDARWWRVGVAYGTIPRKGDVAAQLLGGSVASWCLEKRDDSFSVVHGVVKTALSVRGAPSPRRIGLHLHWEGGLLAFYRADSMEVIHEVRQRFSQPLYPGMFVNYYNQPLKIVDLSRAS
ncbi:E3 ubiquitin/ISG15 ligase TRIM25-like [Lethenteron reissneri]|uniref:E3 ubiquitin/ISG15 ligase TRIM25-like n=1 Tax=Lethenteron reissneri TaxID=7753 RepID=UPI002AB63E3D|nr:E3 ubiquitin/ISG15 ligase TRIM25-like [Lethenteron reissneri]